MAGAPEGPTRCCVVGACARLSSSDWPIRPVPARGRPRVTVAPAAGSSFVAFAYASPAVMPIEDTAATPTTTTVARRTLRRSASPEKHWIYYPEDTVFHRIFVQGNASPHCNPAGGFGLTCEITYSPHKPLPCDGDELVERCIEDCRRVGIIAKDDPILATAQCDLPHAYVVYDHGRAAAVQQIRDWLAQYDVILSGRYSEWEYYNSDHAFLAGKKAAEQVRSVKNELPEPDFGGMRAVPDLITRQ